MPIAKPKPIGELKQNVSIVLDKNTIGKLTVLAKTNNLTTSWFVQKAVRDYVAALEHKHGEITPENALTMALFSPSEKSDIEPLQWAERSRAATEKAETKS